MKSIILETVDIPYKVVKKRNKNTYYHFKRDGFIQINLSRHQTERDAIRYMTSNSKTFVSKFQSHCIPRRDPNKYYLWGEPYHVVPTTDDQWSFDTTNKVLQEPLNVVDQSGLLALEKQILLVELERLISDYSTNPFVDISGVRFTVRRMTSRHGSCNKTKRRISINQRLIHHDKMYLEYVFLHELSHLVHANHSAEFYQLLSTLCPKYKELRQALKHDW